MEKHQKIALVIFVLLVIYSSLTRGFMVALPQNGILFILFVLILLYKLIAYHSGFGFHESLARDFGSENHAGAYAFFFWLLYLIACAFTLFR